jgi:hypothetical protein
VNGRSIARAIALAATLAGVLWAAWLVFAGGFDLEIGRWRISSHQPLRPILWASATLAVFVWTNGVRRTADAWSRAVARLNHQLVAAALTLAALGLGTAYSTTVANASDAYGYVSQADLWLSGHLTVRQPWAERAPWPRAAWTFAPLAYRPAPDDAGPDLVPVYSPGLPLLMAAMKAVGGQPGLFLVVPIAGAVLVLATWGIGRRLGSSGAGLIAAWFVLASPVLLYMLALPMTDVPVAACWALVFYFSFGRTSGGAAAAGVAAALAILIRPNLLWLAVIPALWMMRPGRRAAWFIVPVAAATALIGVVFDRLYGSPFLSGYGELGVFFGWRNVTTNLIQYATWLFETQTPLAVAGLAALALPVPAIWPGLPDRQFVWSMGAFVVALFTFYCLYLPFDAWWFLRFLLPVWPLMMLGLAAVLLAIARRYGPAGVVAIAWLVVMLGAYTFDVARARGAFDLWHADRAYVAAAREARSLTPDNSIVLSELHSGSLRYYGGRMTLRYTLLDPAWLDRAVAWMAERGVPAYALLEAGEATAFRTQFAGQDTIRRLDDAPMLVHRESGLALYALTGSVPRETRLLAVDAPGSWCAPPVALAPLVFR